MASPRPVLERWLSRSPSPNGSSSSPRAALPFNVSRASRFAAARASIASFAQAKCLALPEGAEREACLAAASGVLHSGGATRRGRRSSGGGSRRCRSRSSRRSGGAIIRRPALPPGGVYRHRKSFLDPLPPQDVRRVAAAQMALLRQAQAARPASALTVEGNNNDAQPSNSELPDWNGFREGRGRSSSRGGGGRGRGRRASRRRARFAHPG